MDGGDAMIGCRLDSSSPPMRIHERMRAPPTTSLLLPLTKLPSLPLSKKLDATHSTMGGEERGGSLFIGSYSSLSPTPQEA